MSGDFNSLLTPNLHFEIPQIMTGFGTSAIGYIGSIDRQNPFIYYVTSDFSRNYQKYRKRGKNQPYVYIDPTPNEHNMYDGFIFNAPLIEYLSVVAIFKDLRQLEGYNCCEDLDETENYNFIDIEVKNRLVQLKVNYYRQLHMHILPNDQQYT